MKYLHVVLRRFNDLNRETRFVTAGVAAVLVLLTAIFFNINDRVQKLSKKLHSRESDLVQLMILQQQYAAARTQSSRFSNRLASARADDSPGKIIEEIGIKGKGIQITPVKGDRLGDLIEDSAEVKIEALSGNEAVNLLYRLENGTRPVMIRKASLKTRFDDPSKLDVAVTISLLKSAPQELR